MSTSNAYEAAITEYLGPNSPSVNGLAAKYGLPETSLRREIQRQGIVRGDAQERKRRLVEAHFSGELANLSGELANQAANPEALEAAIELEAEQDIDDMTDALTVCRKAIARLLEVVDTLVCPRDLKAAVEATERATQTIRRIRGLDAPLDFADWSDAELECVVKTGRLPSGRR